MKLTAIVIFIAGLQANAKVNAQERVSLSIKNGSLETVLKEISKQTGYLYVFQDQWKERAKKIDISVANVSLEEVLAICFKDQPFTYVIIKKTIVVKEREEKPKAFNDTSISAPGDIHGQVIDENNQPVAGVTVTIKGTKRATSTDDNGEFMFTKTDKNTILVFTSVNMETFELKLNGENDLSVKLQSKTKQLGEVAVEVNTGYQKIPRERATGSFAQVDNATLNQQVGSNILDRLDGVASGVLFPKQVLQNGPTFMVRGLSTINGPKSPLIVLDNFPYDGDINNINPNDIENITILKDAAASSIWGVRAGNGVVVISTKKGRLNQALKVDLNTNISLTGKPDLHSLRTISSTDYIDVEQTLFNNGFYDDYINDNFNFPALSPIIEILNDQRNGLITSSDANSKLNTYRSIDARDQYSRYMYQQSVAQQYAIDLHGGSGNIAYYLSAGYDKKVDELAAKSDRVTFRSDNLYTPLKKLLLSLSIQYAQSSSMTGRPAYGSIAVGQWLTPYLQFADANGNPLAVATNYRQGYADTAGGGLLLDWHNYPLEDYKHNYVNTVSRDLLANIGLQYQLLDGLNLDIKYLYERQQVDNRSVRDQNSFYTRDLINTFTQINSGAVNYIIPVGDILNLSTAGIESGNVRGQLNYNHTWGKHSVAAIGGGEIRQAHTTGNAGATVYGYNDNLNTANVDFVNAYPTYINGSPNYIPNNESFTDQLNRYVSYYGNASYTYAAKYTVSASGRRDASNLFGVSVNNKWNPLWSAGLSWQLSNESFYKFSLFPYLKLRATYGFSGNTDPSRSGVTTLSYLGALSPSNYIASRISQFPNPDLRWEKVDIFNLGVDFQSQNQVLSGSVEAYLKKGIDLFGPSPIDRTLGLNQQTTIVKNIANMEGRGIDLNLVSKIMNRGFKWSNTLLLSYNFSKTTKYFVDSNILGSSIINNGTAIINPIIGKPLYAIAVYKWNGLDNNGNPLGYVGKTISSDYSTITQKTSRNDLIYKPSLPVIFGSFINTFNWNSFSLSANISYRLGYYFLKPSLSYSTLYNGGSYIGSSDYARRWKNPGDEKTTNVPSMIYPADGNRDLFYNNSEALIDKADNIKLQYINLSYDLDNAKWKKLPLKHLQLYINGSNLGILWRANKDKIDPDHIYSPIDGKTYAIGIRGNF